MKLSRIRKLLFLHLAHLPMQGHVWRPTVLKWGGVNILSIRRVFIGEFFMFLSFDTPSVYKKRE